MAAEGSVARHSPGGAADVGGADSRTGSSSSPTLSHGEEEVCRLQCWRLSEMEMNCSVR